MGKPLCRYYIEVLNVIIEIELKFRVLPAGDYDSVKISSFFQSPH